MICLPGCGSQLTSQMKRESRRGSGVDVVTRKGKQGTGRKECERGREWKQRGGRSSECITAFLWRKLSERLTKLMQEPGSIETHVCEGTLGCKWLQAIAWKLMSAHSHTHKDMTIISSTVSEVKAEKMEPSVDAKKSDFSFPESLFCQNKRNSDAMWSNCNDASLVSVCLCTFLSRGAFGADLWTCELKRLSTLVFLCFTVLSE